MALPIYAEYMQRIYADSSLLITQEDVFIEPVGFDLDIDCEAQKKNSDSDIELDDDFGGSSGIF
jgi:penicillin-binding protein 1A